MRHSCDWQSFQEKQNGLDFLWKYNANVGEIWKCVLPLWHSRCSFRVITKIRFRSKQYNFYLILSVIPQGVFNECLLCIRHSSGTFSTYQIQQWTKQEKSSPYKAYTRGETSKQMEKQINIYTHIHIHKLHSMTSGNIIIEKIKHGRESGHRIRFGMLKCQQRVEEFESIKYRYLVEVWCRPWYGSNLRVHQ